MFTVYQHRNKLNGKSYIGITSRPPEERWGEDGCGYRTSPHFHSAILKYGWDNFDHIILFEGLTKDEACAKEKELISEFRTNDRRFGYNSTDGGEFFKMNDETRIKMSHSMRGNKNGLGHPCSKEKAKKISESQKGRKFDDEHRKKLSIAASNRHTPCSNEKRNTLSINYPNKRRVFCVELNRVFDSVQECGREIGIPATNISKLCKGRGKTLNGMHFKYYEEVKEEIK